MTRAARARAPLWLELNMFFAALLLLTSLGFAAVMLPSGWILRLFLPRPLAETLAIPVGYACVSILLFIWWRRWGFAPAVPTRQSVRRFRLGKTFLVIGNLSFFGMAFASTLIAKAHLSPSMSGAAAVLPLIALMEVFPLLGVVGFVIVVRTPTAPQFLPTRPYSTSPDGEETLERGRQRAGFFILLILGTASSALSLLTATVFAALPRHVSNMYFPTAGALGVLWLTCIVWSAARAHRRVALCLACAPVALLALAQPVMLVVRLFLGLMR